MESSTLGLLVTSAAESLPTAASMSQVSLWGLMDVVYATSTSRTLFERQMSLGEWLSFGWARTHHSHAWGISEVPKPSWGLSRVVAVVPLHTGIQSRGQLGQLSLGAVDWNARQWSEHSEDVISWCLSIWCEPVSPGKSPEVHCRLITASRACLTGSGGVSRVGLAVPQPQAPLPGSSAHWRSPHLGMGAARPPIMQGGEEGCPW